MLVATSKPNGARANHPGSLLTVDQRSQPYLVDQESAVFLLITRRLFPCNGGAYKKEPAVWPLILGNSHRGTLPKILDKTTDTRLRDSWRKSMKENLVRLEGSRLDKAHARQTSLTSTFAPDPNDGPIFVPSPSHSTQALLANSAPRHKFQIAQAQLYFFQLRTSFDFIGFFNFAHC